MGKWLTGHAQSMVANRTFSHEQPITSAVPQGSTPDPKLLNVFISDLNYGMKCSLLKFVDGNKLSGEVNASERRAALQEDQDRP